MHTGLTIKTPNNEIKISLYLNMVIHATTFSCVIYIIFPQLGKEMPTYIYITYDSMFALFTDDCSLFFICVVLDSRVCMSCTSLF